MGFKGPFRNRRFRSRAFKRSNRGAHTPPWRDNRRRSSGPSRASRERISRAAEFMGNISQDSLWRTWAYTRGPAKIQFTTCERASGFCRIMSCHVTLRWRQVAKRRVVSRHVVPRRSCTRNRCCAALYLAMSPFLVRLPDCRARG